jgi:ABC-type cobalamin/Fe3+-siderophores transport system ATPase subunit
VTSISRIKIERFKRAHLIDIGLGDVNVLVGANNSGKSSTIQALHFVITLFQSLELVRRWQRTKRSTIFPEELIYSPADDPYRLYEMGRLQQSTFINFELTLEDGTVISVDLTKGKNANLSAKVDPIDRAQELASLTNPSSIYSPGLAGIARREQFVSDGVLLRAVSRGDANLYLRNILFRLSSRAEWQSFERDLQQLFGNLRITVDFDPASQESIIINVEFGDRSVPLESCGTGLLQAIQILSYVHYFRPSLIILDEPDSHLHPNNQRLICDLLQYINVEYGSKVVLTTHSRHIIDALQGKAQFLWVQNGQASVATPDDHIDVLMDLGALDIKEVAQVQRQFFILTEDKGLAAIKDLLHSNGFDEGDYALQSYYGVTDPHRLQVIVKIIADAQPGSTIIVHRDRDYMLPNEVAEWELAVRGFGAEPFVTQQRDVEDYFIEPAYLAEKNANLTELEAGDFLARALQAAQVSAIENYMNGRLEVLRKAGVRNINHGQLAAEAAHLAATDPRSMIKGKKLRGELRTLFQAERGTNLRGEGASAHLTEPRLAALAARKRQT